jgi:hypothetical protein
LSGNYKRDRADLGGKNPAPVKESDAYSTAFSLFIIAKEVAKEKGREEV